MWDVKLVIEEKKKNHYRLQGLSAGGQGRRVNGKMTRAEGAPRSKGRGWGCSRVEAGVLGSSFTQTPGSICNPSWKRLCMRGACMERADQHKDGTLGF